ncbi:type VII secretion system ESX-1 transmembrane protein B [Salana multivorans]|uniref:Type VII secretion system ESX-1 transmembrane protein B n=1 Tax=Salana multivorans TaxID=120377 RepID=A0A3N2D8E0_9MICO|nr:type VII secretion protein EccB [Salana multivorans]ROR96056.1 type VII secretion system ESX-1 transmembrane protein B [Salana multivorans]
MATKKELLEAQSFSRRRLLTAFTSGAPGGRELEPATPLRGLVAGIVLAALVVAGSFAAGLFNRALPDGWDNGAIILVKDNAARYVSVDGSLVPVPNMASARLLAPADAPIITVAADKVSSVERLGQVGILTAPDSLPAPANLVTDGWQACLAQDGTTSVAVLSGAVGPGAAASPAASSTRPPGPVDDAADDAPPPEGEVSALVRVADSLYLVQGTRRHLIPETDHTLGVLRALGYVPQDARPAEAGWLALLEEGSDLDPFEVADAGSPVPGDLADVPGVVVGSVVVPDGASAAYVVTADGELARLDPFARELYRTGPGGLLGEEVVPAAVLSSVPDVLPDDSPVPRDWPVAVVPPTDDGACLVLDRSSFTSVLLPGPSPAVGGVYVSPGAGALATFAATPDSTAGVLRLVDENGVAFPIEGSAEVTLAETLRRLFGTTPGAEPVTVPYAWGDLFPSGPVLSVDAAALPAGVAADPSAGPTASASVSPSASPSPTASPTASGDPSDGAG